MSLLYVVIELIIWEGIIAWCFKASNQLPGLKSQFWYNCVTIAELINFFVPQCPYLRHVDDGPIDPIVLLCRVKLIQKKTGSIWWGFNVTSVSPMHNRTFQGLENTHSMIEPFLRNFESLYMRWALYVCHEAHHFLSSKVASPCGPAHWIVLKLQTTY